MITSDEILARMRKGETADDIADELAKALNAAQKIYDDERTKSRYKADYDNACVRAAVAMNDAIDAYARWTGVKATGMIQDTTSIAAQIDAMYALAQVSDTLVPSDVIAEKATNIAKGISDVFDWFLRDNGLK